MSGLTRQSPAKINLTLRVCGLRPDGFHEIESLVARIGLYDTVTITPRTDEQATITCDDPRIPCDDSNLALRAWRALAGSSGVRHGVNISLAKRIPPGSGLGGGSSNAATVLTVLNKLWQLDLTRDALADIGAQVGSDVPLFFHRPLCVIRGRGEQIDGVSRAFDLWVVLVLPGLHCGTPEVYTAWDHQAVHQPRPALQDVLASEKSAATLMPLLFNDLEEPACAVNTALGALLAGIRQVSDGPVCMTGSGAALFRLFDEQPAARSYAEKITQQFDLRTEVVPIIAV